MTTHRMASLPHLAPTPSSVTGLVSWRLLHEAPAHILVRLDGVRAQFLEQVDEGRQANEANELLCPPLSGVLLLDLDERLGGEQKVILPVRELGPGLLRRLLQLLPLPAFRPAPRPVIGDVGHDLSVVRRGILQIVFQGFRGLDELVLLLLHQGLIVENNYRK